VSPPNVVLVVADDLGFSDLGCYGGEMHTPNLDALGRSGVRLSHFYNTARCSPSRASLLSGLHPHQTGIGVLTNDDGPVGYPGSLNRNCATVAEMLRAAGYRTCLTGKWHLASQMREPNDAWPTRRGFERFFGTLTGCGSYFDPGTLTRGETNAEHEARRPDFYYTDAITDEAVALLRERPSPFLLYVAYTAPHWPLHALPEDIARFRGAYDDGWDVLRERRMARLVAEGVLDDSTPLSARDPSEPAWANTPDQHWQARRMEAYAAQVDRLDQGVGRILAALHEIDAYDNTLVVFLSDNGASDEGLPKIDMDRFRKRSDIVRTVTRAGEPVRIGNTADIVPGPEDTYASYGRAWANLSNVPFRYYKRWVHEGGIATPFIASWPNGSLANGSVVHTPFQLVDFVPTVLEATGTRYPGDVLPCEGRTMLATLRGQAPAAAATLYWEHTGNAAIQRHGLKLVREFPQPWELYDLRTDRAEQHNLAGLQPDVVSELAAEWQHWADRVGVIPWTETLTLYRQRGLTDEEAAG